MLRCALLLLTTVLANPALAADRVVPETGLVQVVSSLVGIVLLIFLLAWGLKRLQSGNTGSGNTIRIVAALAMGTRERGVLIQVGDEQLLVGVGPGGMRTLHVLEHPLDVDNGLHPPSAFARRLREVLGGSGT